MINNDTTTNIRIVLWVSGKGHDPSSFRPQNDSTQWWNRRDAIVRCTAAYLYSTNTSAASQRELVLLFDEDWSRIHLSKQSCSTDTDTPLVPVPPTEQALISLWKRAIQSPGQAVIQPDGLTALFLLPPTTTLPSHGHDTFNLDTRTADKRQLLKHLQRTCSLDFLRTHGLNSSITVLLRKVNKTRLVQTWHKWQQLQHQQQQHDASNIRRNRPQSYKHETTKRSSQVLETVLYDLLTTPVTLVPSNDNNADTYNNPHTLLVGLLHESAQHELPCWNVSPNAKQSAHQQDTSHSDTSSSSSTSSSASTSSSSSSESSSTLPLHDNKRVSCDHYHVCLFMGAVRDMYKSEQESLRRAYQRIRKEHSSITNKRDTKPLSNRFRTANQYWTKIRIGPVPEFTSKILTMCAIHDNHGRLVPAIRYLIQPPSDNFEGKKNDTKHSQVVCSSQPPMIPFTTYDLFFVCFVPMASTDLSLALEDRNDILWSMIRCTVTSLWRSRVVGASDSKQTDVKNQLLWVFENDGVCVSLDQTSIVSMANDHKAAPSEYQVLKLIHDKMKGETGRKNTDELGGQDRSGESKRKKKRRKKNPLKEICHKRIVEHCLAHTTNKIHGNNSEKTNSASLVLSIKSSLNKDEYDLDLMDSFYNTMRERASTKNGGGRTVSTAPVAVEQRMQQHLSLVVLLSIDPLEISPNEPANKRRTVDQRSVGIALADSGLAIRSVSRDCLVGINPPASSRVSSSCVDGTAATVTILQHFCYQQCLFEMLNQ